MKQHPSRVAFIKPIHVRGWELPMRLVGPLAQLQLASVELSENVQSEMRYRADPNGEGILIFRVDRSARLQIRQYAHRMGLQSRQLVEYTGLFTGLFQFTALTIYQPPVWLRQMRTHPTQLAISEHPLRWYVGVDTLDFQLFDFMTHCGLSATSYPTGNAPLTYFRWPYSPQVLVRLSRRCGFTYRSAAELPFEQAIAKQHHAPEGCDSPSELVNKQDELVESVLW